MVNFLPPLNRNDDKYHDAAWDTKDKPFEEYDIHKEIKELPTEVM